MKESVYFNSVQLMYYKCRKINFRRGDSYIDSPDWMKKKKQIQKVKMIVVYISRKRRQFLVVYQRAERKMRIRREQEENKKRTDKGCVLTLYHGVLIFSLLKDKK